ncbi:radiation-inducible immediate-early gene IEX-1-like [Heterodontus francisci]|uniref:radiation-inducible immediate-early gene IEX-1-like n=1 Tax=Heterodontus francisci TaxID=7792 RepID=UPI00355BBA98
MQVIYTTRSMSLPRRCELSQQASSERQTMGFTGRKPTMPQVFTFEPIRENQKPNRRKRRSLKVLYPPRQVRRSLPTEKDITKRLLLFFVSIVLFQVYTATEDELSLSTPDLSAAEQVSTSVPSPSPAASSSSSSSSDSAVLSVVFLAASPEAETNCSQPTAGGHLLQPIRVVRSCRI